MAVEEVSFVARPGEMVGLLGPNGAGKTTTVSMIAGLLAPDRGEVRIEGGVVRGETDPVKLRLGLVPQEVALHDELSARENLALFGAIYNMRGAALARAMESAFDVAGLADRAKDRVSTFSGGMKRRLNLAAALLHGPRILLLDEPTVGRGSAEPQPDLLQPRGTQAAGEDPGLHHALHGRGRAPLRPHHHHRSRQGDRQRHAGRGAAPGAERERARNRRGESRAGTAGWTACARWMACPPPSGTAARCGSRCAICWRVRRACWCGCGSGATAAAT